MFLFYQIPSVLTFWHGQSRSIAPPRHTLAIICKKINHLSIYRRKSSNPYIIESKTVIAFVRSRQQKYAGGKNEGFSHYVIENTGTEIAFFGLAIMFMKIRQLAQSIHYVHEK